MGLDVSDYRRSLCLGQLRYFVEEDLGDFKETNVKTATFLCRGHHHDPVFDYTGMPGAHPMIISFSYFALPDAKSHKVKENGLPLSIADILFGPSSTDMKDSHIWTGSRSLPGDHLSLTIPSFIAFVVDPCKSSTIFDENLFICELVTVITLSPHNIEELLSDSLTVDKFENIKPPDVPVKEGENSEKIVHPQDVVDMNITDCTRSPNKTYHLPGLSRRDWNVSLPD
jgi:hypothetical protein